MRKEGHTLEGAYPYAHAHLSAIFDLGDVFYVNPGLFPHESPLRIPDERASERRAVRQGLSASWLIMDRAGRPFPVLGVGRDGAYTPGGGAGTTEAWDARTIV